MTARPETPQRLQNRASDPAASVWVAASAGTGKTKVLTDRVLRLLLDGARPSSLLCLTFTKAAASEMANRIARRLSDWASVEDTKLASDLEALLGIAPGEEKLKTARRLFAAVVDAPGGLPIQTIHGFCQSLLRRFPLEAGVAPHFQVMDERDAGELMTAAREALLAAARRETEPRLSAALATVTGFAGETAFTALMRALTGERSRLARLESRYRTLDGAIDAISASLGLAPGESEATIVAAACADAAFNAPALRSALAALRAGGAGDVRKGEAMAPWLEADSADRARLFEAWCGAFLTREGQPFAKPCTKAVEEAAPGTAAILAGEAARLAAVRDRRLAARIAAATAALLTLAWRQIELYQRRKEVRALLDYDDLILATLRLLDETASAWVHYKLDQGIDHVLIDEAQDTNPDQWQVVERLTAEFFAGRGTHEAGSRTLFAVGDVKQSIFGFQRADPLLFSEMRERMAIAVPAAGGHWHEVALETSFRSTEAVLAAVDLVFNSEAGRDGVTEGGAVLHRAWRAGMAGAVEVWPAVAPRPAEEPEAWMPPVRRLEADDPRGRLARLLARRIRALLDRGEILASKGRPIRPGDILVLVRRRNEFVEEFVRALKSLAVPVAGADRMVLTQQMAVMDLMALGNFLLLPEDDLTLAAVLKGPLVGLSEEDLFALAWNRQASLWDALRRRAAEPPFAAAWGYLAGLLGLADHMPPHDLYARVLGEGGKTRLLARLGSEAEDPIDEFVNLTLAHERLHPPSLQNFLRWVEEGGEEIKRDLESGIDAVRVMTVHGAKGLQAPIVILPDTMQVPQRQSPTLLWHGPRGRELPLWVPRADDHDKTAEAARTLADRAREREYRRLLYVALTRAEDRLIVCGWKTRRPTPPGCWYFLVHDALENAPGVEALDDPFLAAAGETEGCQVLRLSCAQSAAPETEALGIERVVTEAVPAFLRTSPPPEPTPPRPLAPSRPDGEEPPVRSPFGEDDGRRYRRGRIIHRLLQLLPEVADELRAEAARRFLARPGAGAAAEAREAIVAEVLAVLGDPAFAALFGPGSQGEVPVVGRVGSRIVSGQIDRLLVTADAVLLVDFKTDRPPPPSPERTPPVYLRQIAAYRALLAQIYPGRPLACALLWTDGPVLMRLPEALLDAAAEALLAPG